MIKDILGILQDMQSAHPYECFPSITNSMVGHLVFEWRWLEDGEARRYSKAITPIMDDAIVDAIEILIQDARHEFQK